MMPLTRNVAISVITGIAVAANLWYVLRRAPRVTATPSASIQCASSVVTDVVDVVETIPDEFQFPYQESDVFDYPPVEDEIHFESGPPIAVPVEPDYPEYNAADYDDHIPDHIREPVQFVPGRNMSLRVFGTPSIETCTRVIETYDGESYVRNAYLASLLVADPDLDYLRGLSYPPNLETGSFLNYNESHITAFALACST